MADDATPEPDAPTTPSVASAADAPPPTADPTPTSADEVGIRLAEFGVTDAGVVSAIKALGVVTVEDLTVLNETDLIASGMPVVQARKLVGAVTPAPQAVDPSVGAAVFDMLPPVPDEGSWLEALKTGGVLKIDPSTVIAAVKGALANRVGLFAVPDALVREMEQFAETSEEQVDPEFFRLRKLLTRRSYGDIFEAIDGLDGSFVTEPRKKELFRRIDDSLWPAISGFYHQLVSWQESWLAGVANPGMMMMSVMAGNVGGGAMLPPGLMQPPDTAALRDHADAVNDAINSVFAGTGVQIASAVAYDANQIRKTLENPRLPQLIGAANRDQMLKQLGVAVNATYPRLETNLTRFVLSTIQVKDVPGGKDELQYFSALIMLGGQIPWDQLGVHVRGGYTGVAGRVSNRDRL